MKKIVLMVIDGFGIGELPDAYKYGDIGSNTYLNTYKATQVNLHNLIKLGLNNIDGINLSNTHTIGSYGKMEELNPAKDTTAGHYEMSGIVLEKPYNTFPQGFPQDFVEELEKEIGYKVMGNEVASGTEIINRLGKEHIQTKRPIIYTSADSVLQIATHIDVFSLDELYKICEIARKVCTGKYVLGRVIARPFATDEQGKFYRLESRKDYALEPPATTVLDILKENSFDTIAVGKIDDVFCHRGITESYPTKNNTKGIEEIIKQSARKDINGLVFANLNDTDSLYGHRNNYEGYANALVEIDNAIPTILENLGDEDILIITGDHGCDPTTESTDHSREYVPLLVYGKCIKENINIGTLKGFNNISKAILDYFNIEKQENFLNKILK